MSDRPGRRDRAAELLHRFSVVRPLGTMRRRVQRDLPILVYHRILDVPDERDFPFDPGLVSATPAQFRRQMRYVRDHFDAITFDELLQAFVGETALPDRPLIVTFDDGYDDNYQEAFPILQEFGLAATFFVATDVVDGKGTFWRDRLAYLLMRAPVGDIAVPGFGPHLTLSDVKSRRAALGILVRHLRSAPDDARRRLVDLFEDRFGNYERPGDEIWSRPMTWSQVREMSAAGMEIGSHTATQPSLSRCGDETLYDELAGSRARLEHELRRPVPVLAYPFGGPGEYDARVMRAASVAGYELAVTCESGVNPLRRLQPFALRRYRIERRMSLPRFGAMLALPKLFASG